MKRKCRRCSEEVESTERICPNCGHDTVTGRPATKLRPTDPASEEPKPEESKTSAGTTATIILAGAIVLTYGFAGWRWFTAQSDVAPVYAAARAVERNLDVRRKMPQLSASVERFSDEIAATRDSDPSESETEALDYYEQAVDALNDSLKLWSAKVEHGPTLDPHDENVAPLLEKYFLLKDDAGNIKADESLQIIWRSAQESLDVGNEFYAQ